MPPVFYGPLCANNAAKWWKNTGIFRCYIMPIMWAAIQTNAWLTKSIHILKIAQHFASAGIKPVLIQLTPVNRLNFFKTWCARYLRAAPMIQKFYAPESVSRLAHDLDPVLDFLPAKGLACYMGQLLERINSKMPRLILRAASFPLS